MSAGGPGPLRTAVLVSGSGTNLQAIIDQVQAGRLNIDLAGVISDRPGVIALERARQAGIAGIVLDYHTCDSREAFGRGLAAELRRLRAGLVVLAGFMRILPAPLVEEFRGRILNVHPSLLPKYPGLSTYRRVLEGGDAWHGSTVHFVTAELDSGPAIIQYRVRVRPDDTEQTLRARVQRGEYIIYPRAIGWMADGRLTLRDGGVYRDGQLAAEPVRVDEKESEQDDSGE